MRVARALRVVLCAHALRSKSRWSQPGSGLKIVPIVTQDNVFSVGAAMRDVYAHQVIKSDFVLVMGDVVSNVRIDDVVREHKARRRTNKDALMSIVVKEAGAAHRSRYVTRAIPGYPC